MTLSTRNRNHGSSLVTTRGRSPMPLPRNAGRRRVRVGGVALALMLLALGAALSGIALLSVSHTRGYLAVAHHLAAGQEITPDVLRTVNLPSAPGLNALPVSEMDSVIGKYATVTLFPGSLLVADDVMPTTSPPGTQRIGIRLPPGGLPSPDMKPGDKLLLFPRDPTARAYSATLLSVGQPDADGVQLYLAVAQDDARHIEAFNYLGGLTAALTSSGG